MKPTIAIISFPGTNGDTENLRALWRNGMDAFVFRWNDSREKLADVDGYFIGAGFAYEDRGRSGMVAARDPLFQFLHEEAEKGKVVLGNCNGAQVLVESGLIPLGDGLRMSLAKNAIRASSPRDVVCHPERNRAKRGGDEGRSTTSRSAQHDNGDWVSPGFLNEWIWITRTCKQNRCATSDWEGVMQIPIAHGEGRFVTKDPELIAALEENDQIAFRYCDDAGRVSDDPSVTLNGSTGAIAGICNPAGNVVALMPHPERTPNGDPYFLSVRKWIEQKRNVMPSSSASLPRYTPRLPARHTRDDMAEHIEERQPRAIEIFIDTLIVNNEERTVEQAARRIAPALKLKQYRYLAPAEKKPEHILQTISLFNPNKECAYVRVRHAEHVMVSPSNHEARREAKHEWFQWNAQKKRLEEAKSPLSPLSLVRRDEPDTGAAALDGAPNHSQSSGSGLKSETGICYSLSGINEQNLCSNKFLEIFANPHASMLERMG